MNPWVFAAIFLLTVPVQTTLVNYAAINGLLARHRAFGIGEEIRRDHIEKFLVCFREQRRTAPSYCPSRARR